MLDNLKYDTSIVNPEAENLISCANEFGSVISSLLYIGNQIQTNWEGDGADITGVLDSINNVSEYYETKIIPAMSKLGNGMLAFSDALNEVTNSTVDNSTIQGSLGLGIGSANATLGSALEGKKSSSLKDNFPYLDSKFDRNSLSSNNNFTSSSGTFATESSSPNTNASSSDSSGRDALSKRKWGPWNTFTSDYWKGVGQDFAENWNYSNCDRATDYISNTRGAILTSELDALETVGEVATDTIFSGISAIGNAAEAVIRFMYGNH
ncbi:MAG: hypothetical protein ACI31S_03300 [Bacilli bacterium]